MDYLAIVKERAEGKDLSVLGGSVKFVVDENVVLIDGNTGEISSEDNEATCTISTDADTMQSIMDGSSSPQAAFMTGKLKVAGDMSIALKVQSVIS
jgi:acyl-CoA dehydrogenase